MLTEFLAKAAALYITGAPLLTGLPAIKHKKSASRRKSLNRNEKSNGEEPLPGDVIYVKRMGTCTGITEFTPDTTG